MNDVVSNPAVEAPAPVSLAVVIFGREGGKPRASRLDAVDAAPAERAAGLMGMRALRLETAEQQALGAKLAAGRLFATGRAFVPFVKADVFAELDADPAAFSPERPPEAELPPVAPRKPQGGRSARRAAVVAESGREGLSRPAEPPADHAAIDVGHRVLAAELYDLELWYVAEVVAVNGPDLVRLRWGAEIYASEPEFERPREHLALLPLALAPVRNEGAAMPEQNTNSSIGGAPASDGGPEHTARVRDLNDALRRSFTGGQIVMTAGVAMLPEPVRAAVLAAVQNFDRFDADNDPYGEHDFGAVEVAGERVCWKIDTYDRDLCLHSPDAADPAVTVRVLTVMLAEEW